jgi:hypothetical protein
MKKPLILALTATLCFSQAEARELIVVQEGGVNKTSTVDLTSVPYLRSTWANLPAAATNTGKV